MLLEAISRLDDADYRFILVKQLEGYKPYEIAILLERKRRAENRLPMRNGEEVILTPQEFSLLEVLILNKNIALSRDKLLELAWGYDYMGDTKTVDVHIQKLRKKLGLENEIRSITKLGYRLEI